MAGGGVQRSGWRSAASWASVWASMASVLARLSRALAKSCAWLGLITLTTYPHCESVVASVIQYEPVASITTRVSPARTPLARSFSCSSACPSGLCAICTGRLTFPPAAYHAAIAVAAAMSTPTNRRYPTVSCAVSISVSLLALRGRFRCVRLGLGSRDGSHLRL